jgi:chlorobactene glucosyltransferase
MSIPFVVGWLVAIVLAIINLTILMNLPFFPRLKKAPVVKREPLISVLIPARNEAKIIGETIESLLGQSYENFELLILDDNSTDDTAAIVRKHAARDKRIQLLKGRPLASGWLGKNWACHQLAQAAGSDYLLFSDADVIWDRQGLSAVVEMSQQQASDLLTIWPTQITRTWAERLVVPLMALVVLGYLPILLVHFTPWRIFAAANGQCLLFRRRAYERIKGHVAVHDQIVEDVALARRLKAEGFRLRMADGATLIRCRMYHNWPEVRDGFAKNILAGYNQSVPFLLAATVFHWLIFLFPWVWLIAGGGVWPLLLILAGISARGLSALATRQRVRDALFMPLSVILMTLIAARSIWWHFKGETRWKDRVVAT